MFNRKTPTQSENEFTTEKPDTRPFLAAQSERIKNRPAPTQPIDVMTPESHGHLAMNDEQARQKAVKAASSFIVDATARSERYRTVRDAIMEHADILNQTRQES